MTNPIRLLCAAVLALAGCATAAPPEPVIKTVEVRVPVPVPCKGLAELGAEPTYPDSGAALQAAVDLFERVKLLLAARGLRAARLEQYQAAARGC